MWHGPYFISRLKAEVHAFGPIKEGELDLAAGAL
jgi:hypothetical protein